MKTVNWGEKPENNQDFDVHSFKGKQYPIPNFVGLEFTDFSKVENLKIDYSLANQVIQTLHKDIDAELERVTERL